jgi:5'-3' exonuclease
MDIITLKNVEQVFGVKIEQYWDYKALKGDESDNVPHPPKIGPVTAQKLLAEHGSLAHMKEVGVEKIVQHWDTLETGLKLVTLDLFEKFPEWEQWVSIDKKMLVRPNLSEDLHAMFTALQFNTILSDWGEHCERLVQFNAL